MNFIGSIERLKWVAQGAYDAWGSLRVRNTFLEVDLDEQETWQGFLTFVADFQVWWHYIFV